MPGIVRVAAVSFGLLAAVLAAGCSAAPASSRATVNTCYAFGVHALERHATPTTVPRACAGLSHAQVNLAVGRAIRTVVGPRPKAVARHLAEREGAYLTHLISTVPPSKPASPAAAPAPHSSDLALSLAALAAWIVTAAAGSRLLAGWLAGSGLRRLRAKARGMPYAVVLSHVALAVAGLAVWIAFLAVRAAALAWIAAGLILPLAGLGMAALIVGIPEPGAAAQPAGAGGPLATLVAETAAPAKVRTPVLSIALHGVFATVTIMLVVLAAVGAS